MADKPTTVDEYVAALSPGTREVVEHLRGVIHATVDGLGERISYGIPTFTLDDRYVVYLAGWAHHVSLYPVPDDEDDFLLATMAFGVRLRGPAASDSEVMLFYDHRHDDYAAGMTINGLGSGVAGHLGLRGRWFFDGRYGISAEGMFGSAIVAGGSLVIREGVP